MGETVNPKEIIRAALMEADPRILEDLAGLLSSREGMLNLKEQLHDLTIDADDYEELYGWMWHNDPAISEQVRTVVLLLHNTQHMRVELFRRLAESDVPDVPFRITYNSSEYEFHVDLPGVPGWGISQYAREDAEADLLLGSLETLYAKGNKGCVPPYFGQ